MQTSKQDAAKSKVPTSHPPERRAKLWQILPNGRPYTRKSQNQLELPPGPVLRAWTAQARNNFLRENTDRDIGQKVLWGLVLAWVGQQRGGRETSECPWGADGLRFLPWCPPPLYASLSFWKEHVL